MVPGAARPCPQAALPSFPAHILCSCRLCFSQSGQSSAWRADGHRPLLRAAAPCTAPLCMASGQLGTRRSLASAPQNMLATRPQVPPAGGLSRRPQGTPRAIAARRSQHFRPGGGGERAGKIKPGPPAAGGSGPASSGGAQEPAWVAELRAQVLSRLDDLKKGQAQQTAVSASIFQTALRGSHPGARGSTIVHNLEQLAQLCKLPTSAQDLQPAFDALAQVRRHAEVLGCCLDPSCAGCGSLAQPPLPLQSTKRLAFLPVQLETLYCFRTKLVGLSKKSKAQVGSPAAALPHPACSIWVTIRSLYSAHLLTCAGCSPPPPPSPCRRAKRSSLRKLSRPGTRHPPSPPARQSGARRRRMPARWAVPGRGGPGEVGGTILSRGAQACHARRARGPSSIHCCPALPAAGSGMLCAKLAAALCLPAVA